jgi:cytidylate kinase
MIITISGIPGSGKTTVATILSEKLGFKHYYMGGIRRNVAKERGMTVDEFNKLGEKDPSTDRLVDDELVRLGKEEDNFIAEGRTAAYFIPNSIKVFLDVDLRVGAERILKDLMHKKTKEQRNEAEGKNIDEQVVLLNKRTKSDKKRYLKYYKVDMFDKKMYDLWIDTTKLSPQEVVERILEFIENRGM